MFSNRLAFTALAVACVTRRHGVRLHGDPPEWSNRETGGDRDDRRRPSRPLQDLSRKPKQSFRRLQPQRSPWLPAKPAPATPRKREEARRQTCESGKQSLRTTTTACNTPLPTLDRGWPSTPAPQAPSAPTVDQSAATACPPPVRGPSGGRAASRAGASAEGLSKSSRSAPIR